jgi:uncharacterized membrane protein
MVASGLNRMRSVKPSKSRAADGTRGALRRSYCDMRTNRARQAALLLGFGLGAFFEGILLHPVVTLFYMAVWALTVAGVLLLWLAVRGPGPLLASRSFVGYFLVGWGIFNMFDGVLRHDLAREWLVFASGLGFVLVGVILSRMRDEHIIERRSGHERRSGSPVR